MRISRGTSITLLVMGGIMLFFWLTRSYTWYANDLQGDPYLALIHLPIIVISLVIGGYMAQLGFKGLRATRRSTGSRAAQERLAEDA